MKPSTRHRILALGLALWLLASFTGGAAHAAGHRLVPPGWPKILSIPRLGISASIEDINLAEATDFKAPYRWNDVAWWDQGFRPGQHGHAAIFGHLDSTCCPAVFWHLKDLRPGDIVTVTYNDGRILRFRVMWQATYANAQLPIDFIYGPAWQRGLVLLTCAGVFHYDGTGYDHKLVVYTRLILPNGRLG